jgi:hypothetical protein
MSTDPASPIELGGEGEIGKRAGGRSADQVYLLFSIPDQLGRLYYLAADIIRICCTANRPGGVDVPAVNRFIKFEFKAFEEVKYIRGIRSRLRHVNSSFVEIPNLFESK